MITLGICPDWERSGTCSENGTVILFDKTENRYLVRYGEKQQLYLNEDQIKIWDNHV